MSNLNSHPPLPRDLSDALKLFSVLGGGEQLIALCICQILSLQWKAFAHVSSRAMLHGTSQNHQ